MKKLYTPLTHFASLNVINLHPHGTFIKARRPTLIRSYNYTEDQIWGLANSCSLLSLPESNSGPTMHLLILFPQVVS